MSQLAIGLHYSFSYLIGYQMSAQIKLMRLEVGNESGSSLGLQPGGGLFGVLLDH